MCSCAKLDLCCNIGSIFPNILSYTTTDSRMSARDGTTAVSAKAKTKTKRVKILCIDCLETRNPTAVQSSESLDIFRRRLKTELLEHSYNWHRACQTNLLLRDSLSLSRSFLLWLQPWSLSTIMLLWHSFLIIIIITLMSTWSEVTFTGLFRKL